MKYLLLTLLLMSATIQQYTPRYLPGACVYLVDSESNRGNRNHFLKISAIVENKYIYHWFNPLTKNFISEPGEYLKDPQVMDRNTRLRADCNL